MYCVNCGSKLKGNPRFCYICGEPVPEALGQTESVPPQTPFEPPASGPSPPPKRRRRPLVTCGVILLTLFLLLSLVIGGAYFITGFHRTNLTAKVVPADAGALVIIRPNPLQLASSRQLQDLFGLAVIAAALPDMPTIIDTLTDLAALDLEVDPQNDLLPWIGGEIGFALLYGEGTMQYSNAIGGLAAPPERPPAAYRGPPFVITMATRSEKRSDIFLADIRSQLETNGIRFSDWTYEGIDVAEIVSAGHPRLAYASVKRVVIVASDAETLESAIDRATGRVSHSLDNERLYQTLLNELPGNRLGTLYLDSNTLRNYIGISENEIPLGIAKGVEMAAIGPSLTRDGLRLNYVLSYDTQQLSTAELDLLRQPPEEHRLAAGIPVEALTLISGQNIESSWDAFWYNIERGSADLEEEVLEDLDRRLSRGGGENQFLALVEGETGVDLKDDLVDNLSGEYAVALVPVADGTLNRDEVPVALVMVAEIDDQSRAERTMRDLADLVARKRHLDFYRERVGGTDVWMMEDRFGAHPFGFGFMDDRLFIATSYEAFELMVDAGEAPLAQSELFERSMKSLPRDGRWSWYFDLEGTLELVSQMVDEDEWDDFEQEVGTYIESIRAISAAAGPLDENDLIHGAVFICMDER